MNKPPIILEGYRPGALGRVTELHGRYYHQHWGFGLYFESKVAAELSAFLERFDASRDGFWVALLGDEMVGSVTIAGGDGEAQGARLRWFILSPEHQGLGIGKMLMEAAMAFCRQAGFQRVYLTTFAGLDAARHLYERYGFLLVHEAEDTTWGVPVQEQTFEWAPAPD